MDFYSMMDVAKDHSFNILFMEVFMLVALIWYERNDFIFNRADMILLTGNLASSGRLPCNPTG
jgi:hypothetical protein